MERKSYHSELKLVWVGRWVEGGMPVISEIVQLPGTTVPVLCQNINKVLLAVVQSPEPQIHASRYIVLHWSIVEQQVMGVLLHI